MLIIWLIKITQICIDQITIPKTVEVHLSLNKEMVIKDQAKMNYHTIIVKFRITQDQVKKIQVHIEIQHKTTIDHI
jgi:hypothetical protein